MYYTSIDHFLGEHADAIRGLLLEAAQEAGGHYTRIPAPQLEAQMDTDVRELIAELCQDRLDRPVVRQNARTTVQLGIDLDDILRMTTALEVRLVPYIEEELRAQPDIAGALAQRFRRIVTSFRSNLTAIKLDETLRRMKNP